MQQSTIAPEYNKRRKSANLRIGTRLRGRGSKCWETRIQPQPEEITGLFGRIRRQAELAAVTLSVEQEMDS